MIAVCINWIPACDDVPDDEISVLLCLNGCDRPFVGHKLGDQWFDDRGHEVPGEVTYWADLPEVPE